MECEMSHCTEPATAFVPILGMMRHVCETHAGAASRAPSQRFSLDRGVEIVRRLEQWEQNPDTNEYERALAEYREIEALAPITLARALDIVLHTSPARVGPETDVEKPF